MSDTVIQIKPLDWKFFDVKGEYGQGVWDANGINMAYTIEDVSGTFAGDKPFYCSRLSAQFGTLDEAKDAAQKHHEQSILCCIESSEEFLTVNGIRYGRGLDKQESAT